MEHSVKGYAVEVENLSIAYGNTTAVDGISFAVRPGNITGIVGPNGAGKTTLLKAMMGLIRYRSGSVRLFSNPPSELAPNRMAYVPQQSDINLNFPLTVYDAVMMGRYPYIRRLRKPAGEDEKAVQMSLHQVGMLHKKDQQIGRLSGGERQRVFLARALSQEAELFFLDEPFSDIDYTSEEIIMEMLRDLAKRGSTVFVIHHNLERAFQYFEMLVLISQKLIAHGATEEVLTHDNLSEAYQDVRLLQRDEDIMVIPG